MKTLLSLFYIPYLRFLGKFHLVAVPLVGLVYVLRLEDFMILAPMLYPFALYTSLNRHQFKDNIPWMLSTFNKRTLITYHLVSQTLITLLLMLLSGLGVVLMTIATITLMPAAGEKAPAVSNNQALSMVTRQFDWISTKEEMILAIAVLFFLTTLYSPVSLKDHLRQMEEGSQKLKKHQQKLKVLVAAGVVSMVLLTFFEAPLSGYLLPLLSTVLVAQVLYVVSMYNKAFTLFHPRHWRTLFVSGAVSALAVAGVFGTLSHSRMRQSMNADQRVAEISFLGAFAPTLSDDEFSKLVAGTTDPFEVLEVFRGKRTIPFGLKKKWMRESKDFGVALEVIKSLDEKELALMRLPETWVHLDQLYRKLADKNPAAARWKVSSMMRDMHSRKWSPPGTQGLEEVPMLQQVAVLEWQRKDSPRIYAETLQNPGLRPEALDIHLDRAPAATARP